MSSFLAGKQAELRLAAIDASVRQNQLWQGSVTGGWRNVDEIMHLSAPDGAGGGGGQIAGPGGESLRLVGPNHWPEYFKAVRSRVDSLLEPWTGQVPEPSDFQGAERYLYEAHTILSTGEDGGGGVLASNLEDARVRANQMSSKMIVAFEGSFLGPLSGTIPALDGIVLVLGGALAAERQLWTSARANVTKSVDGAIAGLNSLTAGANVDWKAFTADAGVALSAVSQFIPGGYGKAVKGAALGLELLSGALPELSDDERPHSTGDVFALLNDLAAELEATSANIAEDEATLRDNLEKNTAQVSAKREILNLSRPEILDEGNAKNLFRGYDGEIDLDFNAIGALTEEHLDTIAQQLGRAAAYAEDATVRMDAWIRTMGLGLGYVGPYQGWTDLHSLLPPLLGDLRWEVDEARRHLTIAVREIAGSDSRSGQTLEEHRKKVESGSGFQPFVSQGTSEPADRALPDRGQF